MANRAAIKANLTIRYVLDSDTTVATNYTAARTFEVMNANAVFNTADNAATWTLSKAGSAIGIFTSTAAADLNVQIAGIDDANANFVSGNVLRIVGSTNLLRGRVYVQILPEVVAAT